MNIDANTRLYCLIGNPVAKSLSPIIHNSIFQYNSLNAKYLAFDIKNINQLERAIDGFRTLGVQGFNVTIPYKIEVIKYLDEIDEKVKMYGAVNTVVNIDGRLKGFNTDGDGFIKSLKDKGISIKNKKIALVGAGGAAHSIAVSLAFEGAKELVIFNRTIENANKLKLQIKNIFPLIDVNCHKTGEENSVPIHTDILINTTPVGMYPNIDDIPISPNMFSKKTLFYDIIYKPRKTKLILEAEKLGYETQNGLNMLINQAIYSQMIWNRSLINNETDWNRIKKEIDNNI